MHLLRRNPPLIVTFSLIFSSLFAVNSLPTSTTSPIQTYFQHPLHLTHDANTRILLATDIFLGKPYSLDSMGDSEHDLFDPRPIIQTEGFDCMTLVTTVLGLIESHNFEDFPHTLSLVRYGHKKPAYFNRHHFISHEWNPSNTRLGFLEDKTPHIIDESGSPLAKVHTGVVDYPNWLLYQKKYLSRNAPLQPQQQKIWQETFARSHKSLSVITYIPFSAFFYPNGEPNHYVINQIPSGSIIEFVTPDWDLTDKIGTHLDVMHLGFVVTKGSHTERFFRHAKLGASVVEVPLIDYLRFMINHIPQAKGIHIEAVQLTHSKKPSTAKKKQHN